MEEQPKEVDLTQVKSAQILKKAMERFAKLMKVKQEHLLLAWVQETGLQPSQSVLCHAIAPDGTAQYWVTKKGPQHSENIQVFLDIKHVLEAIGGLSDHEPVLPDVIKQAKELARFFENLEEPEKLIVSG